MLNIYRAGSLFGEASFLDELPRVSSAVSLTPCQLVPIDRELVTQAISRDPELALAMMKYRARTVRLLSHQVDQMAFRPAQWRVARYLLSLADEDDCLQCSQDDIADSVSVSRVTVSRILNDRVLQGGGWGRTGGVLTAAGGEAEETGEGGAERKRAMETCSFHKGLLFIKSCVF